MENDPTLWFFEKLKPDIHCLLYDGVFTDSITGRIIELFEQDIESFNESFKIKKRVIFLLAECFQNIIRHGSQSIEECKNRLDYGFFMARHNENNYYLVSGNCIENKNIKKLRDQLDNINQLDPEALNVLHKKIIVEGTLSEKGGAGLGLVEMARKSGHKLEYKFEELTPDFSSFYNQVILKSGIETGHTGENVSIDFGIDLHKKMVAENILMLQKGDFSKESILPILNILKTNVIDVKHESGYVKEVYYILVELLLNISNHCPEYKGTKAGVFSLSKKDGKYEISTGNMIKKSNIDSLKKHLDKLNSLNKDELKELYIQELRSGALTNKKDTGIGFIEIARLQTGKFSYCFNELEDDLSFFTINVVI